MLISPVKILLCVATGLLGLNLKKYLNLKSIEVIGVGLSQQSDYQCNREQEGVIHCLYEIFE